MIQHISIRVPWHDNLWDGNICQKPGNNLSCLRLKNILENKNEKLECSKCGKCMADYEEYIPCISEGGAFMSDKELHQSQIHPYKERNPDTHGHFLKTDVVYPPYSFPARPFGWLMYDDQQNHSYKKADLYGIDYDASIEPDLLWNNKRPAWIQEANNHKAIFDYFYQDVVPDKSLCVAYAKQVPFVDDNRRVIVGIGHVKKIIPAIEHNHTNEGKLRSMTWETMICHSIRNDYSDGFIIPYNKMMKYAEEHPDFDISTITVFAPEDAFEEFSFATEHVCYDTMIDVLLLCLKSFNIINKCLDEDYSGVIKWLNEQLHEMWKSRGPYPGLGVMLNAFDIKLGIPMAREIFNNTDENTNIWEYIDSVIKNPYNYLPEKIADSVTPIIQKAWKSMSDERKQLFKLLSRFSLNLNQAKVLFFENEREKRKIHCTDREIIENPYILYEKTRAEIDGLYLSIQKVDRAIFPNSIVNDVYPLSKQTIIKTENDERRIRAIAVFVLEEAASKGHTFLPQNIFIDSIQKVVMDPICSVNYDIINSIETFMSSEIIKREMKNGTFYYKLLRIHEYDKEIEKRIKKRKDAPSLIVNCNWNKMIDEKFGACPLDNKEKLARREKAAVLKILAESRISVLVGDAGTGKTTVLSILCNEPSIAAGGVLLLAPTGKATVRLMESINNKTGLIKSLNVAQFLSLSGRFSWKTMRYTLSENEYNDVPETVIIDESSMLTEEMFGALIQAVKRAKRIIFVGDPNQLPPIGTGKPFVDLVNLLSNELPENYSLETPKVCKCYGELRINRRQQDNIERLDVELSKCFTRNCQSFEFDSIISDIIQEKSNHVTIKKWDTIEELNNLILESISIINNMNGIDDQKGFDESLGANIVDSKTYFNNNCANYLEKWQILSPVKNMSYGVSGINKLIHNKYRSKQIEMSKEDFGQRIIPIAYGPEQIVYGDKVINIKNNVHESYPKDKEAKNYVANGEIGIASGLLCANPWKNKNYLNICFSSQKDYTYSYISKGYSDDVKEFDLELAYALTVHKSQGSQFDTVILVISEPCSLISRELLYTALTRQVNKIIILYNDDPYHLMKYSSSVYSNIAKRFTDLFADVFSDNYKPSIIKVDNNYFDEKLVHKTIRGELVRSKSEVIIANALYSHGLDYEYEPDLILEGKLKKPDFRITDSDTGAIWYWEHCGMMSDKEYVKRWNDKEKFYEKNGIVRNKNLIVTEEYSDNGLDSSEIDSIIKKFLI